MSAGMVDVITCAIFGDCRLRGVGVVREVSLPSPIDLRCRPYNTGHTCDRVIFSAQATHKDWLQCMGATKQGLSIFVNRLEL